MFTLIAYGLLGVVVAVGVVSLLVIILPADHLGPAPRDVVPSGLPARPEIRGEDVARVRLPVTLRGYRMVDTDAILDRLAFELESRDQEIDNLRQRAGLPPKEWVEDSPADATPAPLDDRARDEVLLPVGAATAGRVGAPAALGGEDAGDARAGGVTGDLAGGVTGDRAGGLSGDRAGGVTGHRAGVTGHRAGGAPDDGAGR